jgi:ATP-dependent RNA helicase DeaD
LSAPSEQTPGDSPAFSDLALNDAVLKALRDVGYETPSPIQAATIPHLLAGSDVVGQAQTGTGKTAAFALPILSKIDVREPLPQALILVPTRELAIQVAEAFQRYATYMKGFHVLPVYGGQSYTPQLQSLRRGVQVVVATPGRAMDHIKRGTLNLSSLRHLVLDEADEMLRMGFIDDVEWILEQVPAERQIALFSATMPPQVRRIAQRHLREPAEVTIRSKTTTASKIRQRYWMVSGMHKLDALTRILEAETFDAMLVFARTKIATEELAERLSARGFAVEALNGDIAQVQRERTVARLKSGQIDIVVATDVAARGLDVERVSHVINYDVPYDPESYVHRIGRTGRAGRSGEAILFIAPRERNMLRVIERATRQPIETMQLPTIEDVNERRVARFNEKLTAAIEAGAGQVFVPLIESYERDQNIPAVEIAAALASIAQGATPLLLDSTRGPYGSAEETFERDSSDRRPARRERADRGDRSARPDRADRPSRTDRYAREDRPARADRDDRSNRGTRVDRDDRSDRPARAARGERADTPAWADQVDSAERNSRADRGSGEDQGKRRGRREASERDVPSWPKAHDSAVEADAGQSEDRTSSHPEAADAADKPLNRRERRALERAKREASGEIPAHEQSGEEQPAARVEERESRAAKKEPREDKSAAKRKTVRERPQERSADFEREPRHQRSGDEDVETYRIEVGHAHGVKPNNIVGAIANEVGLEGKHIGRVVIRDDHSFVDLPSGMPKDVFRQLQKVRVAGQPLQISRALKTHVEKLRRERPAPAKFKGKPQHGAQRGRRK